MTATVWPAWTAAVRSTAPAPVVVAQPTSAASRSGTSLRILIAPLAGTTAYGLKVAGP
jgi:hypothetical protein